MSSFLGNQVYDENILQDQISKLRKVQQNVNSLHCPRIDIHEAYVTSLPIHRLHFALLERELSLHGGDVLFISGANGTGKSLFFHGLAGRFDSPMLEGIFCPKLRKIGYGNACFNASYHDLNTSQDILPASKTTLTALSRAGYICEENQAVASINLGEGGAVTIGDIFFRINGLLEDCIGDDYSLQSGNTSHIMISYLFEVLKAVSLFDRLLSQYFNQHNKHSTGVETIASLSDSELNEIYSKLCNTPLTGLSGGEQQRLRLASLFLLERIRYNVMIGTLPKSIIGKIETQPMQLLLLDEPDHHIDSNFLSVISLLMQTLHQDHLRNLIILIIMHKDVISLQSLQQTFDFQTEKRYSPKLRGLRMKSILDGNTVQNQDREEILLRDPLCEKAFEQYEMILKENRNEELKVKTTLSISLLQEFNI
jgi:energy-coupling factor transporter ATP-binding protein EcfA2